MGLPLPEGLSVLARGWLHGNSVLVDGDEPALVDTGYCLGTAALDAFIGPVLRGRRLSHILLTHVHADHAGGVAHLRATHAGTVVWGHPDAKRIVDAWDEQALWLLHTGQQLPPFTIDRALHHGDRVEVGGRPWRVLATPGHATGGVSFLDEQHGVLITGDALWEDGFGLLDPWFDGAQVFDQAALALDNLAEVDASIVVPGHGAPFSDLGAAIARARSRLAYLRDRPDRLRANLIHNFAGFLRLTHADIDLDALREASRHMAEVHPPLPGDAVAASPEALADAVMKNLRASG